MDACANGVRFSLLYDGRCLTAEPGLGCGVALAACAAAGEANATLQTWRLEPNKNGTSFTVYSPAKSETTATPCPEDASPECPAWARLGECEKNAVYMTHACRRACGMCHPKPICSVWSHRTPVPGSAADSAELKLLVRAPKAPFLWLAPRGSEKRHLRVQLQAWSSMFPDYKLARVRCPGMAQAACCLEAGLWGLGHRNAHVQRASLQLCSYHESHMFPFQEWRVECAPDAAEGDAAEEQREGQPEPTAAWLEGLARDEGEEALERLLPHELLGVGEFSPVEAAKAHPTSTAPTPTHPHPRTHTPMLPRPRTHTLATTRPLAPQAAFRRLGRHFHPDKSASPHSALLFDQLRAALDQFKSGSWRTAQDDDDRRRFFTDAAVVELNRTSHAAAAASEGPLWLVQYFAPWCHQCIANKAYDALAGCRRESFHEPSRSLPLGLLRARRAPPLADPRRQSAGRRAALRRASQAGRLVRDGARSPGAPDLPRASQGRLAPSRRLASRLPPPRGARRAAPQASLSSSVPLCRSRSCPSSSSTSPSAPPPTSAASARPPSEARAFAS